MSLYIYSRVFIFLQLLWGECTVTELYCDSGSHSVSLWCLCLCFKALTWRQWSTRTSASLCGMWVVRIKSDHSGDTTFKIHRVSYTYTPLLPLKHKLYWVDCVSDGNLVILCSLYCVQWAHTAFTWLCQQSHLGNIKQGYYS